MRSSADLEQQGIGQIWFGFLAGVVAIGLLVNALVAFSNENGFFSPGIARFFNTFAFFTIQSNILIGVGAILLATNRATRSDLFRTIWFSGLVAISITGMVYHTVLAGDQELTAWGTFGDLLVHTFSPILAILGFLLFGPRGLIDFRLIKLTFIFGFAWVLFTIIRGEIVDWYPYPFIDVADHGYPRVILNVAIVGVLYGAVGFVLKYVDGWLSRRAGVIRAEPGTTA